MLDSESSSHEGSKPETNDVPRFDRSLQELRDLRSQLHYAADYCEIAFLKAEQKKLVLENTKEYICKAMITVVDHLGSVSANLDCLINGRDEVSQTELLMDGLQHRLLTCRQYNSELELAKVRWSSTFPRHHPRYISTLIERSNGALRNSTDIVVAKSMYQCTLSLDDKVPCIKKINTHLSPELEFSPVLPICDSPSIFSKPRTSSFGSQTKDSPRVRFSNLMTDKNKKAVQSSSSFMPFLRRSKRSTSK